MKHVILTCCVLGFFLTASSAVGRMRSPVCTASDTLLVSDSLLMHEVVVAAAVHPVVLRGDTLVYDVNSFPLVEGSRLRELLKRLPGVDVSKDGVVKAQGKVISRIMLNGKEFFANNKDVALNNLPVEILTKVKVYERTTDADLEKGLYSGEKERVLDVITKHDKNRGWLCDASGAGGTEQRYVGNVSLSQFNDYWQNMLSAGADNLPAAFGIGDSYYDKLSSNAPTGDSDKQNYNVVIGRNKNNWEVNGTAYYSDRRTDNGVRSLIESFLQDEKSYTGNASLSRSKGRSFSSSLSVSWKDSLTSVHIDPSFYYNRSVYNSSYQSYTFDVDPYLFTADSHGHSFVIPARHYINSNRNEGWDNEHSYNMSINARVSRKLDPKGRTLTVEAHVETSRTRGHSLGINDVAYYRTAESEVSVWYTRLPSQNRSITGRISYVEPLLTRVKLLLEYGFGYRYRRMDQPVYDLSGHPFLAEGPAMRPIESPEAFSDSLSRFATNRYWNHRVKALLQYVHRGLTLTAGVLYNPHRTRTDYRKYRLDVDTALAVRDWSPEVSLYYRRNDSWNLMMQYAGESGQPDIMYLLPIINDADPLNIHIGNPGLRPSFTHTFSFSFFSFDAERQRQISMALSSQLTSNAMTQSIRYNTQTGGRFITPVNINGNRNLSATWSLGTSFKTRSEWYFDCQGEMGWMRRVGLQQIDRPETDAPLPDLRYVTRQLTLQNYAGLQYSRLFLNVKPYGYGAYERACSSLPEAPGHDMWAFGYGVLTRFEFDNGWSFAADVYNHSRRGYIVESLNGDEFICDAEVSYSFLKGRTATLRLQASDLFGNRSLTNGYVGLTGRRETTYTHSVNSYVLISFAYRFSLFL